MTAYGYSAFDSGFLYRSKVYPSSVHNYYGLSLYTPLNVNPFTAVPRDYATIMLQWAQPQGDILEFRLLANRYGYPVDENDGNILMDSSSFPGTSYADQDVIPGTYHYYGIYLLTEGVWDRAGLTSCLMPFYYAEGTRMYNLLPTYFREVSDTELTQDATNNQYIEQFLNVTGWGMDYLKTQYDMLARHLNDPMAIPLGDLLALAGELGMPFQPEIPASLMRKALDNWTHVCQERGTPGGISGNISLLTGYPVDLRSGRNLMLEDDQAVPVSPAPAPWSAGLSYRPGELAAYGNYVIHVHPGVPECLAHRHHVGEQPTGRWSRTPPTPAPRWPTRVPSADSARGRPSTRRWTPGAASRRRPGHWSAPSACPIRSARRHGRTARTRYSTSRPRTRTSCSGRCRGSPPT